MSIMIFVVIFIAVCFDSATSHLNVYIKQNEVSKLLGLNAELYYVRDGVVNSYAMNFIVPVPAHVSNLEFSWQSLKSEQLPYMMAILYNDEEALLPPHVNISERGIVPVKAETFRVTLPCSGLKSAEIDIRLQLNITSRNKIYDDITLTFRRNKICLKGSFPMSSRNNSVRLAADSLVTTGGTLYVATGCSLAVISITVAIASLLYVRSRKSRHHGSIHTSYTTAAYGSHGNVFIRLDALGRPASAGSGSYATIASIHKFPLGSRRSPSPYATTQLGGQHTYSRPEPPPYFPPAGSCCASEHTTAASQVSWKSDSTSRLKRMVVKRSALLLQETLHEGTFGRVYRGHLKRNGLLKEVVVKTVSEAASKIQVSLLVSEGSLLTGLSHDNVVAPLAVCLPSGACRPLIAYPYCTNGNLKKFLTERRYGSAGTSGATHLVNMAVDAARGIVYLHTRHFIHRDIAARNFVVDENLRLKITDNALSRDLFPEDYHCLCDNDNRPIKWMAIETLQQGHFTTASDVWSFGVLLWEIATLAQQPYSEVDPFEVTAFLRDGYRLTQPLNCPDELFTVMTCCWLSTPESRPSIVQLLAFLQEFQATLSQYI